MATNTESAKKKAIAELSGKFERLYPNFTIEHVISRAWDAAIEAAAQIADAYIEAQPETIAAAIRELKKG